MNRKRIRYTDIPWQKGEFDGIRYKMVIHNNQRIRLVEFDVGFIEPKWCDSPHIGYVVQGEFNLKFRNETLKYIAGDAFCLEEEHIIEVTSDIPAIVFFVD